MKSWYGVLILALVAGGVLWFVLNGTQYLSRIRSNWEANRLQAQWEKPYREDKYGGKTPEETYDMFLDALRKGDTELASKYFVVDEQSKWLKTLEQYKNRDIIAGFIKELENNKNNWEKLPSSDDPLFKNVISYGYTVLVSQNSSAIYEGQKLNIPAGNYAEETEFELNTYTKIWKINSL